MRLRATVCHALRHRIGFVPNYVLTQIPPVRLQGEGHAPRDANQVFGLEAVVNARRPAFVSILAPIIVTVRSSIMCSVAIPQVQPNCTILPEHPSHLAEHIHHFCHVFLRRFLKSNLAVLSIVAQAKVWRACHTHLDRLIRQLCEPIKHVGYDDLHVNVCQCFHVSSSNAICRCTSHIVSASTSNKRCRPLYGIGSANARGLASTQFHLRGRAHKESYESNIQPTISTVPTRPVGSSSTFRVLLLRQFIISYSFLHRIDTPLSTACPECKSMRPRKGVDHARFSTSLP